MNNNKHGNAVVEMDPQFNQTEALLAQPTITSFALREGDNITISISRPLGGDHATAEIPIPVNEFTSGSEGLVSSDQIPGIPLFTVTGFSPQKGPQGTKVFIEGRGFIGVQRVAFGNTNGVGDTPANFTVLSDTLIRTTVPPVTNLSQLGFKIIKVKKGQLLVNATTFFNVTFI